MNMSQRLKPEPTIEVLRMSFQTFRGPRKQGVASAGGLEFIVLSSLGTRCGAGEWAVLNDDLMNAATLQRGHRCGVRSACGAASGW